MGVGCPSCGQDLPDEARFCLRCGTPLAGEGAGLTAQAGPVRDELLIGRTQEREALATAWQDVVTSGRARTIQLVGEVGSGKSRLVDDLVEHVAGDGERVSCEDLGGPVGLEPLADLLLGLCGGEADDLVPRLAAWAGGDEVLAARLLGHVGLAPARGPLDELTGDLAFLLRGMTQKAPLLLAVEDVDAAGTTLLAVLETVVATCHDVPLLTLLTSVPSSVPSLAVDVALRLDPLSSEEVQDVLVQSVGAWTAAELAGPLVTAAAGSPLVLDQLLALLVDTGALQATPEGWALSRAVGELPMALDAVLRARLDALPAQERRVLEAAAVLGAEVRVADVIALGVVPHPSAVLDRLAQRRFLDLGPSDQVYRFRHAAVRAATYRSAQKRRLAELHLRAAEVLELGTGLRERVAVHRERALILHPHLEAAVPFEVLAGHTARVWCELGRRALAQGDVHEAKQRLLRGLAHAGDDDRDRAALLQALGEAHLDGGDAAAAAQVSLEAAVLAEHEGDETVRLLAELCRLRAQAQDPRAAVAAMRACATRFEGRRDWALVPRAWLRVAAAALDGCDWEAALTSALRAVRRAREISSPELDASLVLVTEVAAYGPMPVAEALELCRTAVERVPSDTLASAVCTAHAALVEALDGRPELSRELCEYALDVLTWRNVPGPLAHVRATTAWIALVEDRPQDAVEAAHGAEALLERVPDDEERCRAAALTAYCCAHTGDVEGVRAALHRAVRSGGRAAVTRRELEAALLAAAAEAWLLEASDPMAAVAAGHRAARAAVELGSPWLEGEAQRVLARALAGVDDRDGAQQALAVARERSAAKGGQALAVHLVEHPAG